MKAAAKAEPAVATGKAVNWTCAQRAGCTVSDDEILNRDDGATGAPGTKEYDLALARWLEKKLAAVATDAGFVLRCGDCKAPLNAEFGCDACGGAEDAPVATDAQEAAERFLETPDVQDESGIYTYYSRELVLHCIDCALSSDQPDSAKGEPVAEVIAVEWPARHTSVKWLGSAPPVGTNLYAGAQPPVDGAQERDAARYRWLRSSCSVLRWNCLGHYGDAELDAQIDAALSAGKGEGEA